MTTYADLMTTRTEEQVFQDALTELAGLGLPTSGWQSSSYQYSVTRIDARAQAALEVIRKRLAMGCHADTAALAGDDWTDAFASGFFGLARTPASFAIHQFRITDTSAGAALAKGVRTVRVRDEASGLYFTNAEAFALTASSYADVRFACESSGAAGNIAPGATLTLIASLPGYAATNPAVGATGASVLVAGVDKESSATLISRCTARWSSLGAGGNAAAVIYRIQTADSTVTKYLIDDANPTGPGSLDVYIATDAGTATGGQATAVDAYLQPRKAVGTGQLRVFAAPTYALAVTATLYTDGTNGSAAADAVAAVGAMSSTPDPTSTAVGLGGTVYVLGDIVPTLMGVAGAINCTVSLPAADVVLGRSDLLVATLTVTVDP